MLTGDVSLHGNYLKILNVIQLKVDLVSILHIVERTWTLVNKLEETQYPESIK